MIGVYILFYCFILACFIIYSCFSSFPFSIFHSLSRRADDAFFLYAALHSGKDTLIVSADKLRDHQFRLSPRLRPAFARWLKKAQVYYFHFSNRSDTLILVSCFTLSFLCVTSWYSYLSCFFFFSLLLSVLTFIGFFMLLYVNSSVIF